MSTVAKLILYSTVIVVCAGNAGRVDATMLLLDGSLNYDGHVVQVWTDFVPQFEARSTPNADFEVTTADTSYTDRGNVVEAPYVESLETFFLGSYAAPVDKEFRPHWTSPKSHAHAGTDDWLLSRQVIGASSASQPSGPSIPIPEPGSATLLLLGLANLYCNRRRRADCG